MGSVRVVEEMARGGGEQFPINIFALEIRMHIVITNVQTLNHESLNVFTKRHNQRLTMVVFSSRFLAMCFMH